MLKGCVPKCSNITIKFYHYSPINHILHYRGEGHNSATGERL